MGDQTYNLCKSELAYICLEADIGRFNISTKFDYEKTTSV